MTPESNAIDVATTVAKLAGMGVRVYCLALGAVDLTSAAGRMTMGVINAVAQFERDLLIERTNSEPEKQSNLEMNALWNHFVFPVIGTAKRAFIFKLSGLARAKAEGATLGRPAALDVDQQAEARKALAAGASVSAVARQLGTSRQTIMRVRDGEAAA